MDQRGAFFLVNARLQTLTEFYRKRGAPRGYLVPPAFLSKTVRRLLAELPSGKSGPIVIDNGLFDDIQRIRNASVVQSKALASAFAVAGIDQAANPSRNSLPGPLRNLVDILAAH